MRALASAMVLVPILTASAAYAEDDPATAALKKGYELKKAGKCAEAIVFLRESFEKKPSAKAVLNLAECEESSGKFLTARAHYQEGKRLSESEKQPELSTLADTRMAAIGPRIPHVTFTVPEGADVSVDGVRQASTTDVEMDPGDHRAKVGRDGYEDGSQAFSLAPGERRTVALVLGEKRLGPVARAPGSKDPTPTPSSPEAGTGGGQRTLGAIVLGSGILLVGVGSVLGLTAKSAYDSAVKTSCDASGCDPTGRDEISSARGRADVATVLFVVGGAATVGGVVLYLTAKKNPVRAALAGPGVIVTGTF